MEEYELTDPVVVPEEVTAKYRVSALHLNMDLEVEPGVIGLIVIELRDNNDERSSYAYQGQEAINFMKFMNTANFSVNSMQKRILQKLSTDGKLPPGTVTGAPDPIVP